MSDLRDDFIEICEREFNYLVEEFGFKKTSTKTDVDTPRIRYENSTTMVEAGVEWREQYFYVAIGRRDRKKTKAKDRMPRPEDEIVTFNLEDLLTLRVSGYIVSSGYFGQKLTRKDIERIMRNYARALREHAADVLQGDFAIFPELEKIVRKRMKDHALG